MNVFRRRLASGALALIVLQFALLFAAPVSACCNAAAFGAKAEATRVENDVECCPPGSHPPGQCPLHKNKNGTSSGAGAPRAVACRMMCDAPHGPQFLLGVVGAIAAPESTHIDLTASALHAGAPFAATARPSLPDAPPPRLL